MSSNKRQRLSSPQPSTSRQKNGPSTSYSSGLGAPEITVEDVSDSDSEDTSKRPIPSKIVPTVNTGLPSPMKMLTLANVHNIYTGFGVTLLNSRPHIIDPQSSIMSSSVSSTSSIHSNFAHNSKESIGSPKYMVQEISSTVNDKRFLLTSLDTNVKERLKVMIKKLGAVYIDSPNFVESCTHIILGIPNLGEKFLGGLICGKWLLKVEYIEESYNKGYWIDEEEYEWAASRETLETNKEVGKLAAAAKRCRLKHCAQGPFHNWTTIVLSYHPRRQECYERLFKAGGGRVLNISDFKKREKELKMILVDNPEQTSIPINLKSSNIPLVRINYLHSLVLEEQTPEMGEFIKKKEKVETSSTFLPTVPFTNTFLNVDMSLSLIRKEDKMPWITLEYVSTVAASYSRGVLLPLALGYQPELSLISNLISTYFKGNSQSSNLSDREFATIMVVLSWHMPPIYKHRQFYLDILNSSSKSSDRFLHVMKKSYTLSGMSGPPHAAAQYFVWWCRFLERDFGNWTRNCVGRPLSEEIIAGWQRTTPTMRGFLAQYDAIMTSNVPVLDTVKEAANSLLIIQYTSNDIKRRVYIREKRSLKSGTLDVIINAVCNTLSSVIKTRDTRRILKMLTLISRNSHLLLNTLDKVLINFNKSWVPEHYECLQNRQPSWEKFFNYYAHVRFTSSSPVPSSDTTTISPFVDSDRELDTEIYLIILSAMFRTIYSDLRTVPPECHNPLEKARELRCNLTLYLNSRSNLMLNLMIKSIELLSQKQRKT